MSDDSGIRIDRRTGAITLPRGVLEPALTRGVFLASPMAEGVEIFVQNEPWCSYKLARVPVGAREFIVVAFFHDQQLTHVNLMDVDPAFGSSDWTDWSEEKEINRKARHEEWLREIGVPVGNYSWGSVASEYDQRSGGSDIIITYREPRRWRFWR